MLTNSFFSDNMSTLTTECFIDIGGKVVTIGRKKVVRRISVGRYFLCKTLKVELFLTGRARLLMIYKLDKSKRSGVEGINRNIFNEILLYVILILFWALAIALIVLSSQKLFSDAAVTVFAFAFVIILCGITALILAKSISVYKKIRFARNVLKSGTLTDGTVTSVNKQKIWRHRVHRSYSYYKVVLQYAFFDADNVRRLGVFTGGYAEVPFYVGQNLMIAFNKTDSVILNEFTLSEGAEEFAAAEAKREQVDFEGLSGELIKVDLSKPIALAEYSYTLPFKTAARKKRLKQILKDNPRFAQGRFFTKKCTYCSKIKNNKFYCYITSGGIKHVEECSGAEEFNAGDKVTVAYSGGKSEIVAHYTLKQKFPVNKIKNVK